MVNDTPSWSSFSANAKALEYNSFAECTLILSDLEFQGKPSKWPQPLNGGGPCLVPTRLISLAVLQVPHGNPMCQTILLGNLRRKSSIIHDSSKAKSNIRTVVKVSCLLRSQSKAKAVMPDLAKTELRAPLPAHNSTKIGVEALGSSST